MVGEVLPWEGEAAAEPCCSMCCVAVRLRGSVALPRGALPRGPFQRASRAQGATLFFKLARRAAPGAQVANRKNAKHKKAETQKRRNRIRVTEDRGPECRGSEHPESESQRKDSGTKTTPTTNEIRSCCYGRPECCRSGAHNERRTGRRTRSRHAKLAKNLCLALGDR